MKRKLNSFASYFLKPQLLLKTILLSCLMGLLYSCVQDDMPETGVESELVDVNVKIPVGLKDIPDPNATLEEKQLKSLRIFVFNSNGYTDKIVEETPSTGQYLDNPTKITISVKPGLKLFAIIGNEPDTDANFTSQISQIKHISELRDLVLESSWFAYNNPSNLGKDLPFASESEYIEIKRQEEGQRQKVEIGLERALAKAQLSLIKGKDNTNEVEVENIKLIRSPKQSYLLRNKRSDPLTRPQLEIPIHELDGELVKTANTDTLYMQPRYIFEHYAEDKKEEATAFELKLKIDGRIYTYEVPIYRRLAAKEEAEGTDSEKGKPEYNIYRNSSYRMNITVNHNTLDIVYCVMDWEKEKNFDKEAGEDDSGLVFMDWDVQPEYTYEWDIGKKPEDETN